MEFIAKFGFLRPALFALIRQSFWALIIALTMPPTPARGQANANEQGSNLPTHDTVWNANLKVLQPVVVTTSRMVQRLERSTASLGLLTRQDAETFNSLTPEDALNRMSGLYSLRGQISIRGSGGFTLNAGSRALMLLDGLPLLSADAAEVHWKLLPTEQLEQIEVLKTAGSALYGSSALGGVVHFRTRRAGPEPLHVISGFSGIYAEPPSFHRNPWGRSNYPTLNGISYLHSAHYGNTEVSGSFQAVADQGFRIGETSKRLRGGLNLRQNLGRGWSAGLAGHFLIDSMRLFSIWKSDTDAFVPAEGSTNPQINRRWLLDPSITYLSARFQFRWLNRYYYSYNNFNNEDFALALMAYSEPTFRWIIPSQNLSLMVGAVWQQNTIDSKNLYRQQGSSQQALYAQADYQENRWTWGAGMRMERYVTNGLERLTLPQIRTSLNYHLWKPGQKGKQSLPTSSDTFVDIMPLRIDPLPYSARGGFLRASIGQGFRLPSIAELYSNSKIGGVRILGDSTLNAEESWSAEVGYLHRFGRSAWQPELDLALFHSFYRNLVEFNFEVSLPAVYDAQDSAWFNDPGLSTEEKNSRLFQKYARFKPMGVPEALIQGIEAQFSGSLPWSKGMFQYRFGYTFSNPLNLRPPAFDSTYNSTLTDLMRFLKYRYRHLLRAEFSCHLKSWTLTSQIRYNSIPLNIDKDYYRFIPGLLDHRIRTRYGDWLVDLRLGWTGFQGRYRFNFIVRNALNRSWMPVPGNIGEQRNFQVQWTVQL
ncbi:MAG: TonB-dependent receptor plug domain-containing protein [Bacteroidia bacterium]